MEYKLIPTTSAVWVIMRDAHPELKVYATCTRMMDGYIMTEYGFADSPIPLLRAITTWDMDLDGNRTTPTGQERHEYFLCIPNEVK